MIKAVIFDWGGVLMRTVDDSGRRKWEARLGLPRHAVDQVVHGSRAWRQAQSGLISDDAYWTDVAEQLGLDQAALDAFRRDYFGGDGLDQDMVRFIQELRPRFKTALLSNASPYLSDLLEELGVVDLFDEVVISALVGVQKPDPAIYHILLERLDLLPEQAIFVDDFVQNVEAARALGMQALHFREGMDWRAALMDHLEG